MDSHPPAGETQTLLSKQDSTAPAILRALKRELQSWPAVQLEASALRRPTTGAAAGKILPSGEYLPAVLERLETDERLAYRMMAVMPELAELRVVRNANESSVQAVLRNGFRYDAAVLPDGALRFLALASICLDNEAGGRPEACGPGFSV